jgi:Icc-related predicted phosphoesterase
MKVAVISDLHGNLPIYPSKYWAGIEECELLLICGDILPLRIQTNMLESRLWLTEEFKPWAASLPVEQVYFIAGNHDFWFEKNDLTAHQIFSSHDKVRYLKNEYVDYISHQDSKIYHIFGTPYCHIFGNWPFMRDEETLVNKFDQIPHNIDILLSHDAPYGTSDICFEGFSASKGHIGCPELRDAIIEKKPKYCFHGHLHSSNHGEELLGETKVYNTSVLNEQYNLVYEPLIIRL